MCCCGKNDNKYPYAIKDFRRDLQPHLTEMVAKGIVKHNDNFQKMVTDKELAHLSKSEHPLLRASAFREMLKRNSFDHFAILMEHLDDTAIVPTDAGEFGIWYRTVSDDILQEGGWKTKEAKNKTIEQVITKHNYLRSAYLVLLEIEPQETYYPFIKDMATRPRRLDRHEGYELGFDDIEYALYGLGKFKKVADVKIIKKQLMENVWRLSNISFQLMEEYPDTAYMDILQIYHRRHFYRFLGEKRGGFTGSNYYGAEPQDFIQALAAQQNDRSARLLDTILNRLPFMTCLHDKQGIMNDLATEIWKYPCTAYERLREKIKVRAEEILKGNITIQIDRHDEPIDTTKESIRWYP
jgi:hypothetical protein